MRNEHTCRVCPNCGAVAPVERTTCSQCGQPTALKVTRASESEGQERGIPSWRHESGGAKRLRWSMADRVDERAT